MDIDTAASKLVARGEQLFRAAPVRVPFTKDADADALLNDLSGHPHAFVLACVMDRQIKAERAWAIPFRLSQELGGFSFDRLVKLSAARIKQVFVKLQLHRFNEKMSNNLHRAIEHLQSEYGGNASRIWEDRPSSAEVVYRFLQFDGVGPKIATMATNILARDFKIPLADHYSIDISADVHVRRVFARLGLVAEGASIEAVIYRARALHPAFPGLMDFPAWEIGREWCRPTDPLCESCYMRPMCPTGRASVESAS